MTNEPTDPVAAELQRLRESIDALTARVGELAAENQRLHAQLEASQTARTDLVAQTEHLIFELDRARKELRQLKPDQPT
ncbi:MAG: hypothetical protein ACE37K_10200 [Planctomycetota bacterium]